MTVQKAIENGFTHHGTMFKFIPVYLKFDDEMLEAVGKNKFWDDLLEVFTDVDVFLELGYSFQAWVGEELTKTK